MPNQDLSMYVLASRAGILTGRNLARNLQCRFHTNIERIRPNSKILIRYGNAQESSRIAEDTNCNSRNAIIRASAKHRLWQYIDGENIETPRYYPIRDAEKIAPPFLSRQRIHRAGRDITICNSSRDIPRNAEFLVPLYDNIVREYRVHVLFGNVVRIFRKYPIQDNAHPIIKTSYYGWRYSLSRLDNIKCSKSMTEIALKCAEILGLQFCGVDMAWSSKENGLGRWIVWEINSAPSLNSASLEIYTNLFKENLTRR